MTLHFVKLLLGNKTYKDQVSSAGCTYFDDFKSAIKNKFPHLLNSYDVAQLTLFHPDGITEIDSGEVIGKLNEFAVGPWSPLVVTVEESPIPTPIGSSKKQRTYKGMSTETSCLKYFDALAAKLALFYKFNWGVDNLFPTMGDVLKAINERNWKHHTRPKTLEERTDKEGFVEQPTEVPLLATPLPELFDEDDWKRLKELYRKTTERIHDARLPTYMGKAFIALPAAEFNIDTIRFFKRVGVRGRLFAYEDDLIVQDEA